MPSPGSARKYKSERAGIERPARTRSLELPGIWRRITDVCAAILIVLALIGLLLFAVVLFLAAANMAR